MEPAHQERRFKPYEPRDYRHPLKPAAVVILCSRPCRLLVPILALVLVSSCGDSSDGAQTPSPQRQPRSGPEMSGQRDRDGESTDPGGDREQPPQARTDERGRTVRTTPKGAVLRIPPGPRRSTVRSSNRCARSQIHQGETVRTVSVPPRPGLRANRIGRRIEITYDTGQPPRGCRPAFVSLHADKHTEPYPPVTKRLRLRRLGRHRVSLRIPGYLPSLPDTARASTVTRAGRLSPTARVRITTRGAEKR
jgi:hypothetical protein